ncbi:MAG: O-antigen ligase family protein [Clostridia bacterium]|nr:O-antigen ligase family protein [Clostridia bacterium]
MEKIRKRLQSFFCSWYGTVVQLAAACIITTFDFEVAGVVFFGLLLSLILFSCDDLFETFLPFMLVSSTAIKCFDSFDIFIRIVPLAVVPAAAAVYYFVKHRRKIKIGPTFYGVLAVAVAVTLGGVGAISARAYFSLTSLYYTAGLGFGMALVYVVINTWFDNDEKNSLTEKFARVMTMVVAFCSFMVIEHYAENISSVLANPGILQFQWRNNVSTILMLGLPFPFYLSRQRWSCSLIGWLGYAALLLAGSRGGMVFGTVELLVCVLVLILMDKPHRKLNITVVAVLCGVVLCFAKPLFDFCSRTIQRLFDHDENKIRLGLYERALADFKENPLTGKGLANWDNRDLHPSKQFALCWYHSSVFQIIGSFGIVGIICFAAKFIVRLKVIIKHFDFPVAMLACSFLGLTTMSLVNPGEFCPIPYELIMTFVFIIIEKHIREKKTAQ